MIAIKDKKNYSEAEKFFRKTLGIYPENISALINLGALMTNHKKDYKEAEKYIRKAIEIDPNDGHVWYNLSCLYGILKQKIPMIDYLSNAIKIDEKK